MIKIDKINPNLILVGVALAFVAYKIKQAIKSDAADTLKEGLKNPISALGAFAGSLVGIEPTIQGGTQLTENFDYYIKLQGGIDKYIADKKNGTFTGKPYDQNIDYKKLYLSSASNPLRAFFM
jgi:hypothetical protein